MSDGIGVKFRTLMRAMAAGRCPLRAPTKNNRDDAKIAPFNAPNVEQATNNGIIQDITPNSLSLKVCAERQIYKWTNCFYLSRTFTRIFLFFFFSFSSVRSKTSKKRYNALLLVSRVTRRCVRLRVTRESSPRQSVGGKRDKTIVNTVLVSSLSIRLSIRLYIYIQIDNTL